jgi:hypothetical protein
MPVAIIVVDAICSGDSGFSSGGVVFGYCCGSSPKGEDKRLHAERKHVDIKQIKNNVVILPTFL